MAPTRSTRLSRRALLRSGLAIGTGVSPAEGHQYVGEVAVTADTGQMTVPLRAIDGSVRWSTTLDPAPR